MDSQKQQLIDKLQGATNILVTVSNNPSVDQLAACIGLTLLLNEAGKRATAVYSGETPSTIKFLQPANTIEKTTDSLRDFIISLDISKADKLRYKKDGDVVRIFITPYRTSLTDHDLVFEQGDFNIDVIVALGVHTQEELDTVVTAHGRILHDATVMTINNTPNAELGAINWQDLNASSLSEQVASLTAVLDKLHLDEQIATALLTGIVAETARFSNQKTTAATMSISASLMAAGANQQLVASELDKASQPATLPDDPIDEEPQKVAEEAPQEVDEEEAAPKDDDGVVFINDHHQEPAKDEPEVSTDQPPAPEETPQEEASQADNGDDAAPTEDTTVAPTVADSSEAGPEPDVATEPDMAANTPAEPDVTPSSNMIMDPPSLGSTFTANARPEALDPSSDPLSQPFAASQPLLSREESFSPSTAPTVPSFEEATAQVELPDDRQTLDEIEFQTRAKEEAEEPDRDVDSARDAVSDAIAGSVNSQPLEPIAALNAQPFGDPLTPLANDPTVAPEVTEAVTQEVFGPPAPTANLAGAPTMDMPLPPVMPLPDQAVPPQANASDQSGPASPPIGPPPLPFVPPSNFPQP